MKLWRSLTKLKEMTSKVLQLSSEKKHSMLKMLDDIGGKIDSAIDMLERP